MKDYFLDAINGRIRISQDFATVFEGDLEEIANWLLKNKVTHWMCSSSMDFGTDYGFHEDNVRMLLREEMETRQKYPISSSMRGLEDEKDRFDPRIVELAMRLWLIRPRDLRDRGVSQPLFYAQEIQALLKEFGVPGDTK